MKICPTLLSLNSFEYGDLINRLEKLDFEMYHFDLMDGHFVPNIGIGYNLLRDLKAKTNKKIDLHLMVSNPQDHIQIAKEIGVDMVHFHIETNSSHKDIIEQLKQAGIKVSIAINPSTDISTLNEYAPIVDCFLVMSVTPGFSGQEFQKETFDRIAYLSNIRKENSYKFEIMSDGGISFDHLSDLEKVGLDHFVAGSKTLFASDNIEDNYKKIKEINE